MIAIFDYEQGGEDWFAVRAITPVTGSRAKELLTPAGYRKLLSDKLGEYITGQIPSLFTSAAMLHGIETEPQARAYYELVTGNDVTECGFVTNSDYPGCGMSPDGLIGEDGLLEIKCPQQNTHAGYLRKGELPTAYLPQVQFQLLIAQREWCDFVSFLPTARQEKHKMLLVRVDADKEYHEGTLLPAIEKFNSDYRKAIEELS